MIIMMKSIQFYSSLLIILLLFGVGGCEFDNTPTATDPRDEGHPTPEIVSMEPPDGWFAGIPHMVIYGNNFSENIDNNIVFFNDKLGTILDGSESELHVQPPADVLGDSIEIRVAVHGALRYSEKVHYPIKSAVEPVPQINTAFERAWGVTADHDGNLYVALQEATSSAGTIRIDTDGNREQYIPPNIVRYDNMTFDQNGYMYLARNIHLITRIPPGGGAEEFWMPTTSGDNIFDLAFDEYGTLWAVGNNDYIFRVDVDAEEYTEIPFDAQARSVRYYDGHLYIAARMRDDTEYNIFRAEVNPNGTVGSFSVYFSFSEEYGYTNAVPMAIAFSEAGNLYIGMRSGPDGILRVFPDGSWEPFYPNLIIPSNLPGNRTPDYISFGWDNDTNLYATRERVTVDGETIVRQVLLRINTLEQGAPLQ